MVPRATASRKQAGLAAYHYHTGPSERVKAAMQRACVSAFDAEPAVGRLPRPLQVFLLRGELDCAGDSGSAEVLTDAGVAVGYISGTPPASMFAYLVRHGYVGVPTGEAPVQGGMAADKVAVSYSDMEFMPHGKALWLHNPGLLVRILWSAYRGFRFTVNELSDKQAGVLREYLQLPEQGRTTELSRMSTQELNDAFIGLLDTIQGGVAAITEVLHNIKTQGLSSASLVPGAG